MHPLTTKEKILNAARALFVEHGFAGTSVGNIAKRAGVNHSLVFHHFTNKQQLWVAVKQAIVQEEAERMPILPDTEQPFADFLHALFFSSLRFYRENRDITRMLSWQRLEREHTRAPGVTRSGDLQRWLDAFTHYQKTGDINPRHSPEWIVTMVLSIISSAALDPSVLLDTDAQLHAYFDFCTHTLQHAFKA